MDTIFAVASGSPPSAIAVMRISGALAFPVAIALGGALPTPRQASLRALRDPVTGDLLDRALVIIFPGPASATGEDVVELHLHGGRAIIAAVGAVIGAFEGVRPAVAGEFTRRALINNRIDLIEAEGLGDLLTAQSESQRRAALGMAEGHVGRAIRDWAGRVLALSAAVEAALDHSDEDDVGGDEAIAPVAYEAAVLAAEIADALAAPPVDRLHHGIHVVLAGPPNSGKSSLLNALCDREAAIVSPIAGTTRDRIEVPVMRDGIAYRLTDTAGLTETLDPVEAIGVERARDAVAAADVLLWLGDEAPDPAPDSPWLWLWPRCDDRGRGPDMRVRVSSLTGEGLHALWTALAREAASLLPREDDLALNKRQRALLADAQVALGCTPDEPDLLIVAEQLRLVRGALDRITGAVHVEAMLDALFARFCIGK